MPEIEKGKTIRRRRFIVGGTAAVAVVAGAVILGSQHSSQEQQPLSEKDQERKTDIQTFRNAVSHLLNQNENKEAFAKIFSDDFMNTEIRPTPEEPNPQRFRASRGKTKVYINPAVRSENRDGDSISYSIRTSPHENNEQRKEIPSLSYGKDSFEGKVVFEGLAGIVGIDNKFTGQLTKGEDPKNKEDEENEAEELRYRVKKIFNFTPEQWGKFDWDTYNNAMRNTGGIPQFGVEGIMEEDGKKYTVKLGKSGAVGLVIDYRPKNFGFTSKNYEE